MTTDVEVSTNKHIQFRDSGIRVKSGADGQLDIDADGEVEIVSPTVDIDASTAVTIDTATLTITGAANVTGDLDVDNINIDGNTIISTDTDGNIALTPNGTGEVDISKVDIDSGAIDGVTLGTNSAVTEAQIDNININGNAITSTDSNGNIALTPDGTGEVDISKVDIAAGEIDGVTIGTNSAVTDLRVDNIKVDGNTVSSTDTNGDLNLSPNGTGTVVINTDLDVDNININGNSITSTNTDGDVAIAPNGTGSVLAYTDKLGVGFLGSNDAEITTNGTGDLTLSTNSGTNSGTIKIEDGANQDIVITPNGSGSVEIHKTDSGSSAGPIFKLFRSSGSPFDDDELGEIQFLGKDSGGGTNAYATITAQINDASAGTENGLLKFDVEGITTDYGHGIYESLAIRAGSAGFPIVYFGHGETQLQWFKWGGNSSNGSLTLRPAAPAVNNDRVIELPDQSGILGYVALSTTTVTTAVADITFDNLSTTFDAYAFHINLHPASDGVSLRVQF